MYRAIFVLVAAFALIEAKKLPSYLIPCKRNDPNLNECAKQSAIKALPSILKGDKEYKYPSLTPLHLPLIEIKPTNTLSITLRDVILDGLQTVVLDSVDFNLEKKHIAVVVSFSLLNLQCQYEIDGQILVLPIKGDGPGNFTFEDVTVYYSFDYDLITKNDGKLYINPDLKPVVTYTLGNSHYHFDNLFGGDSALGDNMNKFLNEHSSEVNKDLGESISQTINAITTSIIKGIISFVPYDDIFI